MPLADAGMHDSDIHTALERELRLINFEGSSATMMLESQSPQKVGYQISIGLRGYSQCLCRTAKVVLIHLQQIGPGIHVVTLPLPLALKWITRIQ
jgi:hypothetical protein